MKKMDCFRACTLSNRLVLGGFITTFIGCGAGYLEWFGLLAVVLAIGGLAALLLGGVLGLRYERCPHCGEPLYNFPRLLDRIPGYCPHCGKRIDPPADR